MQTHPPPHPPTTSLNLEVGDGALWGPTQHTVLFLPTSSSSSQPLHLSSSNSLATYQSYPVQPLGPGLPLRKPRPHLCIFYKLALIRSCTSCLFLHISGSHKDIFIYFLVIKKKSVSSMIYIYIHIYIWHFKVKDPLFLWMQHHLLPLANCLFSDVFLVGTSLLTLFLISAPPSLLPGNLISIDCQTEKVWG